MADPVSDLLGADARVCWHPFTQAATAPPPLPVVRASGAWLELADGRRIFDGLSSWWSTLHGHAHPRLVEAIAEQAATLDHVLFAGCTHPPGVRLAERLVDVAPEGIRRVFYSDDGSTAVEVALKMAFQLHLNRGEPERRRFLCLEGGYHGDTIGAMSAGDPGVFGEPFAPLLFEVERVKPPLTHARAGERRRSTEQVIEEIDRRLAAEPHAAVVIEPMVQGAAGMRMMPVDFLVGLRERCSAHGALLIADEVMTGFGRTGRMFALEHAGVTADLICLSKGISGGTLPLAATLAPEAIYEAFLDEDMRRGFLHGHTYTANPIACAAGIASLELLLDGGLQRAMAIERFYARRLPSFEDHPAADHVRWLGTIGVVELAGGEAGYDNPAGKRVQAGMLERGYLVRPLGPVVYTMPPLCATEGELVELYDALGEVLDEVAND